MPTAPSKSKPQVESAAVVAEYVAPQRQLDAIGPGRPLFCLELANNHQGDLAHARALIEKLAQAVTRTGADAILKLQFRQLDSFLHPADRMRSKFEPLSKHTKRFVETRLDEHQFEELVGYARSLQMPVYATPFDEASVDRCLDLGFDLIKVASCSAYDWPLLRKVASTGLPVICSLGGLSVSEMDEVVDFFTERGSELTLMHCVASYPTALADLQLDQIRQLKARYPGVRVGYSGHEGVDDLDAVALAVALGAEVLERHVGLSAPGSPLNAYSLSPEDTERWIEEAQRAAKACSFGQPRRAVAGERESLQSLKRGIYARRTIPAGTTVTEDDVFLAMPCLDGQFNAGKLYEICGSFTPMETILPNMPIGLDRPTEVPDSVVLSSIAARVKEILEEARIHLDDTVKVELSHQYGFDRFFEWGAVIIDVVNRDYCKKLIIQLPSQKHPAHKHHQKEETFQVLAGSMDVVIEGERSHMEPGQKKLVRPGQFHSFATLEGVVFEEISTTHVNGDSEYEDTDIPSDPATRKTEVFLEL